MNPNAGLPITENIVVPDRDSLQWLRLTDDAKRHLSPVDRVLINNQQVLFVHVLHVEEAINKMTNIMSGFTKTEAVLRGRSTRDSESASVVSERVTMDIATAFLKEWQNVLQDAARQFSSKGNKGTLYSTQVANASKQAKQFATFVENMLTGNGHAEAEAEGAEAALHPVIAGIRSMNEAQWLRVFVGVSKMVKEAEKAGGAAQSNQGAGDATRKRSRAADDIEAEEESHTPASPNRATRKTRKKAKQTAGVGGNDVEQEGDNGAEEG